MKKLFAVPVFLIGYAGFMFASMFAVAANIFEWLGWPKTADILGSVFDWYLIRYLKSIKWVMS
jgi:hypothetical protein